MNKRNILVAFWIGLICGMILLAGIREVFAGEKEEFTLKIEKAILQLSLAQANFEKKIADDPAYQKAKQDLNAILQEVSTKYDVSRDTKGNIMLTEKPKPKPPEKKESEKK